jgi:transglutaminase-like putative cysteine protease
MTAIATSARQPIVIGGSNIGMSALLLLALAIAISGLHSVLEDITWWFGAFGTMFVVFTAAATARYFLRRGWWGTVIGTVAALLVLTLFFGGDSALLGFIPAGSTFVHFGSLITAANNSIAQQSLPAVATTGIQFLVSISVAGLAILMDAVAIWLKRPALAGLPLLAVLVVPSLVLASLTDGFTFELVAIVYLLMVLGRGKRIQPRVAVTTGVIAVIGALIAPALLPPVVSGGSTGSGVGVLAQTINPIINLGADLRNSDSTAALSYTTTASTGEYLRLTTLDAFQGKQWEPATPKLKARNTVKNIGAPPGLTAATKVSSVSTSVQVDEATGNWLPIPYPSQSISGLKGNWEWEDGTLSVRSATQSMQGERYTVASLDVEPTIQELEAAGPSSGNALAKVPAGLDPIVAATAKQVTSKAKTLFDKAVALQTWFRGGTFTYSTKAPATGGYDGSGLDVIVPFLKTKKGYCVHFATTMAVMARTLGIPSRVAVGFLPGTLTHVGKNRTAVWQVSSSNLHAWPELYFKGAGWVRFEPTPSKGFEPNFPSAPGQGTTILPTSEPTGTATSVPRTGPIKAPNLPQEENTKSSAAAPQAPALLPSGSYGVLGVLAVLILILAPATLRISIRRRRLDRVREGVDPAEWAWFELRESARDLGLDARESSTPTELAAQLAAYLARAPQRTGEAAAALAELQALVEDEVFGLPAYRYNGEQMADELRKVLQGLRSASSPAKRLAARMAPPTLVDRILGRSNARAAV